MLITSHTDAELFMFKNKVLYILQELLLTSIYKEQQVMGPDQRQEGKRQIDANTKMNDNTQINASTQRR